MESEAERQALRLGVIVLRRLHGGNQRQFGAAASVSPSSLSLYEEGRTVPLPRTLARMIAAAGLTRGRFERLLAELHRACKEAAERRGRAPGREAGAGPPAAATAEELERLVDGVVEAALSETVAASRGRAVSAPPAAARAAADRLCRLLLEEVPPPCWRLVVEEGEEYQTWAVCERLCEASAQAAAGDVGRARLLAEAALLAAERAPAGGPPKSRLLGHAWAFIANSHRVAGDLDEAERAFHRSDELWQIGEPASPAPLDPTRRLDLKASLRRYQGRLDEALELLDQPLASAATEDARARLQLKRARTLEFQGHYGDALETLAVSAPWVEAEGDLRLRFGFRFNRIVNLCHLQRFAAAASELEALCPLAVEANQDLDLLRLRWLEARVAEGLGRKDKAAAGLAAVWQGFADRDIPFDAALAALELAALELDRGRTQEVKALARASEEVFAAQAIPSEHLASVRVFWEAVEIEAANAAMARRLVAKLERARPASAGSAG